MSTSVDLTGAPCQPGRMTGRQLRSGSRRRTLGGLVGLALCPILLAHCAPLGASPSGARAERDARSPQWRDGRFANPQKSWSDVGASYRRWLFGPGEPNAVPKAAVVARAPSFDAPPSSGLAVTWFGHSSIFVEIDGVRVLIDPLWGERASPIAFVGPRRWFAPPVGLETLRVDVVLISHDHFDHLDLAAVEALRGGPTRFIVPLGVGAHLERWGIPPARIVELDWWESAREGALVVTATPARHASGRLPLKSNRTLWAGFALITERHRVWYSGDTGFHDTLTRIGEELGPFDLTLVEAGQYDANWPDAHLGPELAVLAHQRVRGSVLLPVHWGALQLAPHAWTEPVERVLAAARCADVEVLTPRPGERIEPTAHPTTARWWPDVPWRSTTDYPVVGTQNGSPEVRVVIPPCAETRAPSSTSSGG